MVSFSKQHMCNYYAEVSVRENKALSECGEGQTFSPILNVGTWGV